MVDMLYNYNAIFGRGVTNMFSAFRHPGYLRMKLPSAKGIIAVYGDQDLIRIAEEIATLGQKNVHNLDKEKPKEKEPSSDESEKQARVKPAKETKMVTLFEGNTSKQVTISAKLDNKIESELIQFLRDNSDIFAWSVEDLLGVDRSIIEHILDVNKNHPPVKQKLHKLSEERKQAAKAEVQCLLNAGGHSTN
jgi:spore cortex formation protein SpoVR/YcgB (stage V sporulation)